MGASVMGRGSSKSAHTAVSKFHTNTLKYYYKTASFQNTHKMILTYQPQTLYHWLNGNEMQLQCISNGVTSSLHEAIDTWGVMSLRVLPKFHYCPVPPVYYIDGLAKDYSNSIANALELLLSCTKPLIPCCMDCVIKQCGFICIALSGQIWFKYISTNEKTNIVYNIRNFMALKLSYTVQAGLHIPTHLW